MRKTIIIEGMKCENCAKHVENAFKNKSVKKVKVNLKKNEVNLISDLANDEIKNIIEETGYKLLEIR